MTPRRIVLTTFGSFGDLHPYVAIALELKARGEAPVVATTPNYREKVEALGVEFRGLRPDLADVVSRPETMRRVMDLKKGSEVVVRELAMPYLRETYEDLAAVCDGADVVVGHPLTFTARLVSEKTGIPWVSAVMAPLSFFSAIDPPAIPAAEFLQKAKALGPWFHRAIFRLARWNVGRWCEPLHRLRADLGLPPARDNALFEGQHSPRLVLALFSAQLARMQADWPPQTVVTGFPFFDEDGDADLDPALARFLADGPPPLVFTLGSSAVKDAGRFYEEGAEAAARTGRRAVLLVGKDTDNRPRTLPPGVAAFDYAPYSKLFPRAAAIVHQGGVGTTGQAMRAGRPMIVMPYAHDQPDNAARVTRLGIARTIPRTQFTAERAAREIETLLGDPSYAARAVDVGLAVSFENGARAAADAIERVISSAR